MIAQDLNWLCTSTTMVGILVSSLISVANNRVSFLPPLCMGDLTLTVHHQVFMSDGHNVNGTYLDEYQNYRFIYWMTIPHMTRMCRLHMDGAKSTRLKDYLTPR